VAKGRKSGGGFFFGLLLGMIIGAALAILFAPQPGEAPRGQSGVQTLDLRRRGQERVAQFTDLDAYSSAFDEVKSRYSRAKSGDYSIAE
jgi:gas vesicle protein